MHQTKPDAAPILGSSIAGCGRMSEPRWCVFSTHPQAERLAIAELNRAGYTAYMPLIAIEQRDRVTPSIRRIVRVPLFLGYGFVLIDEHWTPVRYTAGVRDLLMMGGRPAPVPTSLVERLQAADEERCQLVAASLPDLPRGAAIVVSAGALEGRMGVVKKSDGPRVQVSLMLFGRLVPTWLDRAAVELMA